VTLLAMAGGGTALITEARCARFGFDYRLEVLGSEDVLRVTTTPRPPLTEATKSGITQAKPAQNFFERFEIAFIRQLDAFISNVKAGRPLSPNGAEGRIPSAIAEAAAESARTGKSIAFS
jgi:myo-inositol 2-dehydrogenase/D-chiro-inositol 1-dehydrogenase